METEIQIFNNLEFGQIRTAGTADDPKFCLADVCNALDLLPSKVAQRLEDDVLSKYPISDSLGRTQQANFVNEDGLYDVILDSRKPEAKKFRKWITSEVLPSIRKHGVYMSRAALDKALTSPDFVADLAAAYKKEQQRANHMTSLVTESVLMLRQQDQEMLKLMRENRELKSLIDDTTLTVKQIAAEYDMSAISFNIMLSELGIQHKVRGRWVLSSALMGKGYVHTRFRRVGKRVADGKELNQAITDWTLLGRKYLRGALKEIGLTPKQHDKL